MNKAFYFLLLLVASLILSGCPKVIPTSQNIYQLHKEQVASDTDIAASKTTVIGSRVNGKAKVTNISVFRFDGKNYNENLKKYEAFLKGCFQNNNNTNSFQMSKASFTQYKIVAKSISGIGEPIKFTLCSMLFVGKKAKYEVGELSEYENKYFSKIYSGFDIDFNGEITRVKKHEEGMHYFITDVFLKIPKNGPWSDVSKNAELVDDKKAMYLYEANANSPSDINYLAKKIVDLEESKKLYSKKNEFQYKDAIYKYTKLLPKKIDEYKKKDYFKVYVNDYLGKYDFEKQMFKLHLKNNSAIEYDLNYEIYFDDIEKYNELELAPDLASYFSRKFKLGESEFQRRLQLEIVFEPVKFVQEVRDGEIFKMIYVRIHVINVSRKRFIPMKEPEISYMFSTINEELYDGILKVRK